MKKIFTLLTMLVCMVTTASAVGEVFTISFNGANEQSTEGYFSWNDAKHSFNKKFVGTYDGVEYTNGLKMEGATKVSWKSEATATVTIVQSTWSAHTIKLDGTEIPVETAVEDAANGVRVYTITDVPAGDHAITRGSNESGIFLVKVEYTGAAMTTLEAPVVTANTTTGEVTIGAVANAKEIRYTIDGTDPTAENGEVYSAPFVVADGTVVKAAAIGDDVTFITSAITEVQVLIEGTVPVAPVVSQQNGSVAIVCATPAATIEYSTDNATWTTYTRTFTLFENATLYTRASRTGVTSEVATVEVTVPVKPTASTMETIILDGGSFQADADYAYIWNGTPGTSYEGWSLVCGNETKSYSTGSDITEDEYTTIKASNGAANTIKIPAGKKVVFATIYSYVNAASSGARTCGWREVGGVTYDVNLVPNQAFTNLEDHKTNPDIRMYQLDATGEFSFTNTGEQHAFFLELMVCDAEDNTLVSGIDGILAEDTVVDGPVYNIAGQQVTKSYKGIVIKNGKKYIQK